MGVVSDPADPTEATVDTIAPPGRPSDLAAGTSLGKYRLERVLGSGGVGVVWAAHDPDLERTVALKVLRSSGASSELRTRLLREARAMARLKHPNVLTVYEVGSQGDRDFIAMELVEGDSLDAWLVTEPRDGEVWQAILAAGRGLAAAHRAGLVHRDFKPQNVLRGHDGRVLVTDFGLARTHSADTPVRLAAASAPPDPTTLANDVTLDASPSGAGINAPLTQTGALLGTPAYMAPEQYLGATSDPRTDQFAFCVTAWQLLAGRRPFEGNTLEELQRAVNGGAMNARGDIPRGIRRVLSRGLAVDPAQRWADMNALLIALDRARAWPRRILRAAIAVTVVAGIVLGSVLTRASRDASSSACEETPEDAIARAWPPELRATLLGRFAETSAIHTVVGTFDAWTKQWGHEYRATCTGERTKQTYAKLGCLLGERDMVAGYAEMLPLAPPNAFYGAEMGGVLPRIEACAGDAPMTLPGMPREPDKVARIRALRPQVFAARFGPPRLMLPRIPGLVDQATKIGWDPLTAEAHQAFAVAARRADIDWEGSRDHYKTATQIARRAHHYHLEAETLLGLLDAEIDAATDPTSDKEFLELLDQARAAVDNAGKDPAFVAHILHLEGVFAASRGDLDTAIAKYESAVATELAAGHYSVAIEYAKDTVADRLLRDRPDDVAAAWQLLADIEAAIPRALVAKEFLSPLWVQQSRVAMLRGDLAATHAYADRDGPPTIPDDVPTVSVSGRVVDGANRPVAGATVVAWNNLLVGDAKRVHVGGFNGARATSDAAGNFTMTAPRGGGIIAEVEGQRSRPHSITSEPVALVLEPTRTITGTVESDDASRGGLVVFATVRLGSKTAWSVGTPVDRAGGYRLAGIPPGDSVIILDYLADPNRSRRWLAFGPPRDGMTLRWRSGVTLDVIVRGMADDPTIRVFRGRVAPKTRAEVDKLGEAMSNIVAHDAFVIGIGDQTPEGMKEYRRGDRHARFIATAPGTVTACVAGPDGARADHPAVCKTIDVPSVQPTAIRHGHGVYPVVPVVLP